MVKKKIDDDDEDQEPEENESEEVEETEEEVEESEEEIEEEEQEQEEDHDSDFKQMDEKDIIVDKPEKVGNIDSLVFLKEYAKDINRQYTYVASNQS